MGKSEIALINPQLLIWAREEAYLKIESAADMLNIRMEKLTSWENGLTQPTIKQLRQMAHKYRQPFAAFYLPVPPEKRKLPVKDFRRLPGDLLGNYSTKLIYEIRNSLDKRLIALELYEQMGNKPVDFTLIAKLDEHYETVADRVRAFLDITLLKQRKWKDSREAFNYIRQSLEDNGVLVFQATDIELKQMRGYSICETPLPIIVVNRKDSFAARTFTMLHELTHLMIRVSGVCDLDEDDSRPPEEQFIEVFCNRIAGNSLVPRELLTNELVVINHKGMEWANQPIEVLAKNFSVSREVIIRRLLDLGLTTNDGYLQKIDQYIEEYANIPKRSGFVPPAIDMLSSSGKLYPTLVIDAYKSDHITQSDVSDYLGIRLKHLPKVEGRLVEGE